MKTCRICQDEIIGAAQIICPACAAAMDDLAAKKTGVKAEIRGQVIEALKWALSDLEAWHKEAKAWYDDDGEPNYDENCKCSTCQMVIPKVKAALERLEETSE